LGLLNCKRRLGIIDLTFSRFSSLSLIISFILSGLAASNNNLLDLVIWLINPFSLNPRNAHYSSLYAKLCRTLHIPYSQRYLAKAEAIQGSIDWHNMLEDRKRMFGRTNRLEIALDNGQLEKMYGIKSVSV